MPQKKVDPRQPDAVDVAVGRHVRTRRIARGLSQTQLGNRLGVTFQQVQKYESGANRMSIGRLRKAAAVFGISMSALFEGGDSETELDKRDARARALVNRSHALLADSRAYRLARAFNAIKHEGFRVAVVETVEKIATSVPQKRKRRRRGGKSHAR